MKNGNRAAHEPGALSQREINALMAAQIVLDEIKRAKEKINTASDISEGLTKEETAQLVAAINVAVGEASNKTGELTAEEIVEVLLAIDADSGNMVISGSASLKQ